MMFLAKHGPSTYPGYKTANYCSCNYCNYTPPAAALVGAVCISLSYQQTLTSLRELLSGDALCNLEGARAAVDEIRLRFVCSPRLNL